MKLVLLIHILLMANLVGLLVPELIIGRRYRGTKSIPEKRALASLHLQLNQWAAVVLFLTVLTGTVQTISGRYPWFAFNGMLWLAIKQVVGLALVIWIIVSWNGIRSTAKKLRFDTQSEAELEIGLKAYDRIKGQSHMITGLAWLLAALAILKV